MKLSASVGVMESVLLRKTEEDHAPRHTAKGNVID